MLKELTGILEKKRERAGEIFDEGIKRLKIDFNSVPLYNYDKTFKEIANRLFPRYFIRLDDPGFYLDYEMIRITDPAHGKFIYLPKSDGDVPKSIIVDYPKSVNFFRQWFELYCTENGCDYPFYSTSVYITRKSMDARVREKVIDLGYDCVERNLISVDKYGATWGFDFDVIQYLPYTFMFSNIIVTCKYYEELLEINRNYEDVLIFTMN